MSPVPPSPIGYKGMAVENLLVGLGGRDNLVGLGGPDILKGGGAADVLEGGAGADRIFGEDNVDTATYAFVSAASPLTWRRLPTPRRCQGRYVFGYRNLQRQRLPGSIVRKRKRQ